MPKRYYAHDDNMSKKSFCPRWQNAQIVILLFWTSWRPRNIVPWSFLLKIQLKVAESHFDEIFLYFSSQSCVIWLQLSKLVKNRYEAITLSAKPIYRQIAYIGADNRYISVSTRTLDPYKPSRLIKPSV